MGGRSSSTTTLSIDSTQPRSVSTRRSAARSDQEVPGRQHHRLFPARCDRPSDRNLYSWSANGALLGTRGTPHAQDEFRTIGIDTQSYSGGAGVFEFDRRYTSANPNVNGVNAPNPSGNALASLLLGFPSGSPDNQSRILVSAPANYFTRYYGAYFQDDFRVSSRLTNAGLRIEHEDGLREEDRFTVAFDRTLNPGARLAPPERAAVLSTRARTAPTEQGNQPAASSHRASVWCIR
jgi:hypothetical protein